MVVLDATIVNVALPSIQNDLGLSEANLQWIVNAYTLVFGGFLLLGGRAGDLLGRKRLFLVGLVIFTGRLAARRPSTARGMLIGCARAPGPRRRADLARRARRSSRRPSQEGAERARALGVWAAIAIGGSAVGLVLGGVLTQDFSWPWIFFVNVPVGIVAFVLSLRLIPESRDEHAHRSFDIAGAVTVTGGLMTLVYAIVGARPAGWTSARTIGLFTFAAVLLAAFVADRAAREGAARAALDLPRALAPDGEHRHVPRRVGDLRDVLLQHALHPARARLRAAEAGLAFLPFTAGIMVSAGLASRFAPRLGVRPVAATGCRSPRPGCCC